MEIVVFLREKNFLDDYSEILEDSWRFRLAFLADILENMNLLNLELQGKKKFILDQIQQRQKFY